MLVMWGGALLRQQQQVPAKAPQTCPVRKGVRRRGPRREHHGVPPGRAQRPEPASDGSRRGRETERPRRRHPAQSGLLVHAAGRDVDRGQPDRHRQRLRRGERLPPRLGIVGVLRDDRFVPRPRWRGDHARRARGGNQGSGSHYDGIAIFPTPGPHPVGSPDDHIDGGGDPIAIFDRAGIAYYGQIHFERENDTNGIFVNRSTNGGFTWSRPCVPFRTRPRLRRQRRPAPAGRRHRVVLPGQRPDPERQRAVRGQAVRHGGPTPSRRGPQCFDHEHAPATCAPGTVGVDRIYITWTRFDVDDTSKIYISFSDDEARSWSPARVISGSAPFCVGGSANELRHQPGLAARCPADERSPLRRVRELQHAGREPVRPRPLHGRRRDVPGPFFVTPVFDVNYPQANAAHDLTARLAASRPTARSSRTAASASTRGGDHRRQAGRGVRRRPLPGHRGQPQRDEREHEHGRVALQVDERRHDLDRADAGQRRPVDDPGEPQLRPSGSASVPADVHTGNDQWFPWLDISWRGWMHGTWQDRRLDTTSPVGVGEWPTSKTRQGNYIAWYWGGRCRTTQTGPVDQSSGRQCVHPDAAIITQPTGPVESAGRLPGSAAVGLPVPELRDLRRSVQLGLLLPRRHLLRRLRERGHRHGQQRLGDVDGCPKRALVSHADRSEPGLRAVRRLGGLVSGQQGRQRAAARASRATQLFWVTPCPTEDD